MTSGEMRGVCAWCDRPIEKKLTQVEDGDTTVLFYSHFWTTPKGHRDSFCAQRKKDGSPPWIHEPERSQNAIPKDI
jgi:hypothetical protein